MFDFSSGFDAVILAKDTSLHSLNANLLENDLLKLLLALFKFLHFILKFLQRIK